MSSASASHAKARTASQGTIRTGSGPNRRRYPRSHANLHCRPSGTQFFATQFQAVDIGFGGMQVRCDEEQIIGDRIQMDIFFPETAPLAFAAQVVWVNKLPEGSGARFAVGLCFVDLSPDALRRLLPLLIPDGADKATKSVGRATLPQFTAPSPPTKSVGRATLPQFTAQPSPKEKATDEALFDDAVSEVRPLNAAAKLEQARCDLLSRMPVVVLSAEALRAKRLDPRTAFLLSLMDGRTTVEQIVDLGVMPGDEVVERVESSRARGIIELR
jgi:hypothetical protein